MNLRPIAAAAYLAGVHPEAVRRWIRQGHIQATRHPTTRRIEVDITEVVETARVLNQSPPLDKVESLGRAMAENDRLALESLAAGRLEVDTEQGAIYRIDRRTGRRRRTENILKDTGYGRVIVNTERPYKYCNAHRVVWLAAHGPIPLGMFVNHINGVRSDNRLANLELVTRDGNFAHSRGERYYSVGGPGEHSTTPERFIEAMRQPRDDTLREASERSHPYTKPPRVF